MVPRTVSAGRFPLTASGLVVSLSNISVVLTAACCVWPAFRESSAARVLSKFGRHSLMVFALHVYLFKSIQMALHASGAGGGVAIGAIVASFVVTAAALDWYESRVTSQTGPSVRALRFLFG